MKKTLLLSIFVLVTSASSVFAQATCPTGLTSPLQVIDGQTWVFHTASGGNGIGQASLGKFTAKYNPATSTATAKGTLTITETVMIAGQSSYQLSAVGSYQINPDCSGGRLIFQSAPIQSQFSFVFVTTFSQMYLTATETSGSDQAVWGDAKMQPAFTCPATPLSVLSGSTFGFELTPANYVSIAPPVGVGIFTASTGTSTRNTGLTLGFLNGNFTLTPFAGSTTANEPIINASYTVSPDCSGGTINFQSSILPEIFQYLFVNSTFSEIYMLSLDPTNPIVGDAKKI
jgi:hypothetical protein